MQCRIAAAVLLALKFSDNIHYKFKSSQCFESRASELQNTPAQNSLQNGHSRSFKVTCFGVSGKAIRDQVILNTNVGLTC